MTKPSYIAVGKSRHYRWIPAFAGMTAEGWYRALAGDKAKPEVIEAMHRDPFPELVEAEEQREKRRAERRQQRQRPE